jgi:hypothetical protein
MTTTVMPCKTSTIIIARTEETFFIRVCQQHRFRMARLRARGQTNRFEANVRNGRYHIPSELHQQSFSPKQVGIGTSW